MIYDSNILSHVQAIREALRSVDGRAHVDFDSLNLEVRARGRRVEFLPQFLLDRDGRPSYTPRFVQEVRGFIGWRPYFNRVWPVAVDKQVFKDACQQNGLSVPRKIAQMSEVDVPVIVKRAKSSFGLGIVGPLTPDMCRTMNIGVMEGDYIEQFIPGEIAKIWFWNDKPIAMDVLPMPFVIGDGRRSVRDLVQAKAPGAMGQFKNAWDIVKAIVAFQGLSMENIPSRGREVLVDFRYQSVFLGSQLEKRNVLPSLVGTPLETQLVDAGRKFYEFIPEAIRFNTLFTIDAIIGADGTACFLEMNCNPFVHVDAYRPMLESILSETHSGAPGHVAVVPTPIPTPDRRLH